ncbi:MAG: hypothetical protein V2A71_08865, partial [Candidatus Eisenbacteria bacterium]
MALDAGDMARGVTSAAVRRRAAATDVKTTEGVVSAILVKTATASAQGQQSGGAGRNAGWREAGGEGRRVRRSLKGFIMNTNLSPGWLWTSILVVVAVQLAGIKFVDRPIDPYDSKEYLSIARSLLNGGGYGVSDAEFHRFDGFRGETPTRMRQPGYPFYLLFFYWSMGRSVLTVQLSQVLLNALTFFLVFLIARRTWRGRLWPGTLLALALYFPLWFTSALVLTETLFTFLLVTAMLALHVALYADPPGAFGRSGSSDCSGSSNGSASSGGSGPPRYLGHPG